MHMKALGFTRENEEAARQVYHEG